MCDWVCGNVLTEVARQDGTGSVSLTVEATPSAMKVIDMVRREREAEMERARVEEAVRKRREAIIEACRLRVEEMRKRKPLYPPRRFDPVTPVFFLLLVALALHTFGPFVFRLIAGDEQYE